MIVLAKTLGAESAFDYDCKRQNILQKGEMIDTNTNFILFNNFEIFIASLLHFSLRAGKLADEHLCGQ